MQEIGRINVHQTGIAPTRSSGTILTLERLKQTNLVALYKGTPVDRVQTNPLRGTKEPPIDWVQTTPLSGRKETPLSNTNEPR